MKKALLILCLTASCALPALAAENLWLGTWKLDVAKSHFTGDTFTYSKAADGKMHFSDGSAFNFDFGIDGKEYKSVEGRETRWTLAGDNAWNSVSSYNGTVLSTTHHSLSPDGKTLTIVSTGKKPDGSAFKNEEIYTRVTGTTGLIGKWKSTKVTISAPDGYVIHAMDSKHFDWEIPAYKERVSGAPDGSDSIIAGPTVTPGTTLAVKWTTPLKVSFEVKEGGKIVGYETDAISADGKSLTEVSWSPGKESEKSTSVYFKQ